MSFKPVPATAAASTSHSFLLLLLLLLFVAAATVVSPVAASESSARCNEIYVVKEGESLQTISDKCNDPFILEENTHINDFDDVFPGLVLKITNKLQQTHRKLLFIHP
ncbi:hypothetical protein DM860_016673 [Cuscuta australis]|uniref:LysM domain-containing protein n=1 Tax=Cuscuta australis TaxID=267555 RepID=A0A328DLV8_9ASTE|nr:hypothetical protein DM860_016673 [Cuscuta australis]